MVNLNLYGKSGIVKLVVVKISSPTSHLEDIMDSHDDLSILESMNDHDALLWLFRNRAQKVSHKFLLDTGGIDEAIVTLNKRATIVEVNLNTRETYTYKPRVDIPEEFILQWKTPEAAIYAFSIMARHTLQEPDKIKDISFDERLRIAALIEYSDGSAYVAVYSGIDDPNQLIAVVGNGKREDRRDIPFYAKEDLNVVMDSILKLGYQRSIVEEEIHSYSALRIKPVTEVPSRVHYKNTLNN